MNADALSSLADFTPAERQNPALLVQGKKLGNPEVSLHNTNLTRLSNNIVGAKVLALIGAVRLEKGAAASKDLARHVLFGSHASEEILQGKGGIDSNDVVELAVASLDEQVLKTSPNKVLANLLVHMNIQVEWKTEVIELRNSADEKRELESLVDTADRITDSVHESIEKIRTTGKEVASMQSALDEAKKARQERLDRPAPEKVAPEPTGHEAITDAAPRKEDGTALAPVTEEQSSSVVELDDDDDYTLQFDAHGAPIDIRQTSLKYPIEPGPHQVCFRCIDTFFFPLFWAKTQYFINFRTLSTYFFLLRAMTALVHLTNLFIMLQITCFKERSSIASRTSSHSHHSPTHRSLRHPCTPCPRQRRPLWSVCIGRTV